MRRLILPLVVLAAAVAPSSAQPGQTAAAAASAVATPVTESVLAPGEQEQFLRDARVVKVRGVKKGITGTQVATLSNGGVTHDASVQAIDESAQVYQTASRLELNFRDYWGYNVAAYRLARMLGLDNVPVSVKRPYRGSQSAFTWWVDDVVMDEQERVKRKRVPPNPLYWNSQIHVMRIFDELIANTDRNQGNMLLDRRWKLWLIDHSRAFRTNEELRTEARLLHCERTMFARMQALTEASLKEEVGDYLTDLEIESLLKRRDRIVARITSLGPAALYDLRPPAR